MSPSVSRKFLWLSAKKLVAQQGGKRVLVLGCAPLPFENARMNYAPGTRTWQFAQPLAQAGHAVCVVCSRIPGAYDDELGLRELSRHGVLIYTLEQEDFDSPDVLPGLMRVFDPEVLVGASALPSRRAAELAEEQPLWVDLFGDPMAEAQAKAAVDAQDDNLAYFYLMWSLLERGDAFSAVSERQCYAVIGQLGLFGRLNRATHGLRLVHTIPCGVPAAEDVIRLEGEKQGEGDSEKTLEDVGKDDFLVLWSGGFNTWCDVETLFRALELAMADHPALVFVSTGGKIRGHDEDSYRRFVDLVESSCFGDRFCLKGRLPAFEAQRYLDRADLALVTEKPIYERVLGSSARMVDWLARGVPFICARVSELAETIAEEDLGWTYPPGDAEVLARLILEAAADREEVRRRAERGRQLAIRDWNLGRTTGPLCRWVAGANRLSDSQQPQMRPFMELHVAAARQPDRARIVDLEEQLRSTAERLRDTAERLRDTAERLRDTAERLDLKQKHFDDLRGELGRIHCSKFWRVWMAYLGVRGKFLRLLKIFTRGRFKKPLK